MRRLALLLLVLASGASGAQDISLPPEEGPPPPPPRLSSSPRLYGGPALGPGLFAGYSAPQLGVFTQEAAFYLDYNPKITGQGGQLRLGLGIGGSVRLLQVLEIIGDYDADRLDIDAGVRIGPAFDIPFFSPTGEQRTRAFSVLVDAFARGQYRMDSNRVVFVELGGSQPLIRGGLSIGIGG